MPALTFNKKKSMTGHCPIETGQNLKKHGSILTNREESSTKLVKTNKYNTKHITKDIRVIIIQLQKSLEGLFICTSMFNVSLEIME